MTKTLLEKYVDDKVRNYQEPQRERTPRGERIGFSSQKFHAALFNGLTNLTLKDISEKLDVSYGLLRQWAMDESFKELGQNSAADFGYWLALIYQAKASPEAHEIKVDDFRDADIYSETVKKSFVAKFFESGFIEGTDFFKINLGLLCAFSDKVGMPELKRGFLKNALAFFEDHHRCDILLSSGGLHPDNRFALIAFLKVLRSDLEG